MFVTCGIVNEVVNLINITRKNVKKRERKITESFYAGNYFYKIRTCNIKNGVSCCIVDDCL